MAWYKVHDEAERLEHAVSSDFEALLSEKLGSARPVPARQLADARAAQRKRKRGLLLLSEAAARRPLRGAERL